MAYPNFEKVEEMTRLIRLHADLKTEHGAEGVAELLAETRRVLRSTLTRMKQLPADPTQSRREPNSLSAIRALRPKGPRRLLNGFNPGQYRRRVEGALQARVAGNILGSPVEGWSIAKMLALAVENGDAFPPTNYWRRVPEPKVKRYGLSPREAYTRKGMSGVPVDDDLAYTLLGLLIVEDHGPNFTTEDVGTAWLKYLPYACTAEMVALDNLNQGAPAATAGVRDNPYREWIGADIRADPWGYMAPGWPEHAAAMAYRDAYLSHRRQGIYGAMFFAAAIAAAFAVEDPVEAVRIGLTEIPRHCTMSRAVRWALSTAPQIKNYADARAAVDARFKGMHPVHTINNACLTIWGITIGGTDITRVIGQTVAMGLDNDCTAATAGSIVGAVVGARGVPSHWTRRFDNTIHSYLKGKRRFSISGVVTRFVKQARGICEM